VQPARKSPLTVAGQWRLLTALPEHSTKRQFTALILMAEKSSSESLPEDSRPWLQNLHEGNSAPEVSCNRRREAQIASGSMTPEIVIDLPSRSIRIGVNSAGLLACGSSDRSCLPSTLAPVANLLLSSPLTVAGPRRILTGFPCNTES